MFAGKGVMLSFDQKYTVRIKVASITRYSDLAGTTKIGSMSFTYDAVGQLTHEQHKNGSGMAYRKSSAT